MSLPPSDTDTTELDAPLGPEPPKTGLGSTVAAVLVWVAIVAFLVFVFQVRGLVGLLAGIAPALIGGWFLSRSIVSRKHDAEAARGFRWNMWVVGIGALVCVAIVVMAFGGRLPVLDQIPKNKTAAYLDQHLPVAVTYTGEADGSKDGRRLYRFTDADGREFECIARWDTDTGVLRFTDPDIVCTWPAVYAEQYDEQLAQAFAPWRYEPAFHIVYIVDEADAAALAPVLAAQLELIRSPVVHDPNRVFSPVSFSVRWAPRGGKV
ncbi:MAG: hypothetical protein FWD11_07420, partial [Micrococcales bacterium]|nr:hypothetical protein [Micrococcales bacterium]